ncbi:hypothetical protein ACWE42_11425 [Sutcliffiella cohnii]
MNRLFSFLIIGSLLTLGGCSSSESEIAMAKQQEEIMTYSTFLTNTVDSSNKLLNQYNNILDNLYIENMSEEQLSKLMRELVKESSELIREVESGNYYNTSFYEFHTNLIKYLNEQHQLFLDSVEMANTSRVDKSRLRQSYIKIKDRQSELINSWVANGGV